MALEDLAAEPAFAEILIKSVTVYDSMVSPMKVVSTGAREWRNVFTAEQFPAIFKSYMDGSKKACIIASAMVGMIFLVVFGDKRHYLKKCNASKAAKDKERSVNRHEEFGDTNEI
ncbi:hypothetical protein BPOR_0586g00030 [Botrytis porri]|uniref:Uncharacterized protein n=1 Tax=Botrytis porri TaxID=87229 RepID=A0A4Z1KCC6_9HELO|nr:hypothetical protein BPOR_0586g00030 [Botrytis porri]